MHKHIRFSIWYAVIAFVILIVLEHYFLGTIPQDISYSEFRRLAAEGKVEEAVIAKEVIRGKAVEGALPDKKTGAFVTARVEDPGLVEVLEEARVTYTGQVENTWFKTLLSWIIPTALFFGVWIMLFRRMRSGPVGGLMSIGKSKAKVYVEGQTKVTFEDVAGIDEAEEEVKEVVEFLKHPERFQELGGRIPKGVLLVGPPGTGKTLLARAVAGEAGVPFFSMSGSDFVEMFVGVGAARVRDLFQQAKEQAPCIIFIDELDALGKARGIGPIGGHDEREQTLNQLLTEMDGFDVNTGVIIIAATNRPEILDMALLRPGRFDRQILVDRPNVRGREEILKIHVRSVRLAPDVDLGVVAARTSGFVGADLANLVNEAALHAARRGEKDVHMEDFEEAIDRIVAGLKKKGRLINEAERKIVAYHESGHAITAECLPLADKVHRVSIVPRGVAALGYTLQLPTEDRYLMTRSELLDKLSTLLGGRAAEEVVFGEASTGAQNDLEKATQIAQAMVKQYGMSEELGLVSFEPQRRQQFIDVGFPMEKEYSEQTAARIDAEIQHLIEEAHGRAKGLLEERRDRLDRLAQLLLEKEVVEGEELRRLVCEEEAVEA